MKRYVSVMAAVLVASLVSEARAQTPAGYPWLVHAISNATGKPIDPIGANSEQEARETVEYLNSFEAPGFSSVRYVRNPNVGGTPPLPRRQPAPSPPSGKPSAPGSGTNPSPPPLRPVTLPNTSWNGGETLQGYGKLTFRFGAGETVYMIDTDGSQAGTFSRSGNSVSLRFYNGAVVYTGTVQDNIIYGSGRNGRKSWTFSVRLQ